MSFRDRAAQKATSVRVVIALVCCLTLCALTAWMFKVCDARAWDGFTTVKDVLLIALGAYVARPQSQPPLTGG